MKNIHVYVKNFIVTYSLKCYTIKISTLFFF
nr:MAG TPA_asm: hypothetical protein [Caudoviricetes sp.]